MKVYLDNNATTRTAPEVVGAMLPYFGEEYGNASSFHQFGQRAAKAMNEARQKVADLLGVTAEEIVFTGSGSESNNYFLKGVAARAGGGHLIVSAIEHPAVLRTARFLVKHGFELTELPVDGQGLVSPDDLQKAIRSDTILVSIILANNEIGTVQDIGALGVVCREAGVLFHTDAVQAVGKIPLNLRELPVDYLSASAHKLHGPKGVGAAYLRKGVKPPFNLIHGGHHERRRRASTENVPGIVAFGRAAELTPEDDYHRERIIRLRSKLEVGITQEISEVTILAREAERLPNTSNVLFHRLEGESIVMSLDFEGIAVSTGSACSSGSLEPSHVILALGFDHAQAQGSIRFSLSRYTTDEEIGYVLERLPVIIHRLRNISAL
ncbi:aminotransferase class V-fold PLP-dependent enzyme [bacterium]|nr:aminotransferase class V-fold PLP-dependent enzyme [bacterium]